MPELGTWEKFCLDEAVAYYLAVEEKKLTEEVKSGKKEVKSTKGDSPSPRDSSISLLNNPAFKKQ